jgi:hypothetical protein
MKLNLTNKKGIGAFALVFFMLASMFFAMGAVHAQATTGTFSVYQSGSTSVSSVTVPSSPNPIGNTVKYDIYISGASDIWGWAIPTVNWNTAVVHLTKVVAGPFLSDNAPGGDSVSTTGTSSSLFDNTDPVGNVQGGLAQAITAADQSTDASGVVITMTFTVVGYGTSAITINGAYLIATSTVGSPHIPVSANSGSLTVSTPSTTINLYQHGSTTNAAIQWPSASNPIGGTFSVDAYISGALGNVWGWSIGVTWNPSVLECTGVTEGSYLSSGGATLFAPGFIDNYLGKVDAGISDAYSTQISDSVSSGVLCTLSFQILSYGNSALGLTAGTPGTLVNDNLPAQVITPTPVLTGATYSWTPAPATGPVAAITTEGSPFGAGNTQTLTNYAITFDGTPSQPGQNTIPPGQSCPITTYAWSITLIGGTIVTASTPTVALTATQVGMNPGTITATLTVTAPSPTNTPAPTYTETSTTTFSLTVLPPLPAGWNNWSNGILDIWTQNGGQGLGADCTSFGPQQLVDLTALVTFNGAPVALKTVSFDIYLNGVYIDVVTATTNANGYATTSYRLPWQDSNPTSYFGTVTVTGSVDVSQVTLTDSCQFYYGYQLSLQGINGAAPVTITNGVYSNGVGPVFFRNYAGLNTLTLTADVVSFNWTPTPFYLTATVFDTNNVPVSCQVLAETAPACGNTPTGWNGQAYTMTLTLPTWAFVGPATVEVNILNNTPANNGLAFSPQQSASLYIYNGT